MFDKLKNELDFYERVKDADFTELTKEEREHSRSVSIDIAKEIVINMEYGMAVQIAKLILTMYDER